MQEFIADTPGFDWPVGYGAMDFWNALDMIGGKASYQLGSAFNDGKGQPPQSNAVSHGCVPSRFRQINVINTGRRS